MRTGDNYKRARAWPQREGQCGECGRWIKLHSERGQTPPIVNLHKCKDGRRKRTIATDTYEPKFD